MTKAITATACMQLVEQGKLQLDQPMGKLLPQLEHPRCSKGSTPTARRSFARPNEPITLRHLLTHTAGFTYSIWSEPMTQLREGHGNALHRRMQECLASTRR